jgi:hypothetical protein
MRFRSVNAALKWAMEMKAREIVTTSRFGGMASSGKLNAQELHAQAEFILLEVGKLPYAERAVVALKFGQPRIEIAMSIADEIGYCGDKLAAECVQSYQADKPSIRDMAEKFSRSVGTVHATRKRVFDRIDPIYFRAMGMLETALCDLIERAA